VTISFATGAAAFYYLLYRPALMQDLLCRVSYTGLLVQSFLYRASYAELFMQVGSYTVLRAISRINTSSRTGMMSNTNPITDTARRIEMINPSPLKSQPSSRSPAPKISPTIFRNKTNIIIAIRVIIDTCLSALPGIKKDFYHNLQPLLLLQL